MPNETPRDAADGLATKLAAVELAVFDVDGTLTDAGVTYGDKIELQRFDVRDGQGLVWLRRAGVVLAWISGRGCPATERRAGELGVEELHLRAGPKGPVLEAIQTRLGIGPERTLAMGDDAPDLALFDRSLVRCCPSDAVEPVRREADLITTLPGGRGAAREVADRVLAAKGVLKDFVEGSRR